MDEDQLAYAGALINRLRRERDDERVAHVLTREALQSRIDALEAQLARREAELEYCATRTTHIPILSSRRNDANVASISPDGNIDLKGATRTGSSPKTAAPYEPKSDGTGLTQTQALTNEEIIKILNMTAARNRTLEVEIKTLSKRVSLL